ncbi:holo-ACP synthase [Corynebacterium hindlerae]|uniref:holo-ACP synthase AcpS n=1 Tax=Corynebacterium hindlerae TaxID=699041 RepID=UPI001AD62BCF|nr:holo-ACP synthase [Corynebacterium hindlerae]QTH59385.1 holo-ACP synthase [Corynebacterium hindlerae]
MFVGIDLVHIPGFATQLEQSGSRFLEVFHPLELRRATGKTNRTQHLAGCWAAKEAFVKAWSQSMYGQPPVAEEMIWSQLCVEQDQWGRVRLRQDLVAAHVEISISHDGDYATAVCLLVPAPADR